MVEGEISRGTGSALTSKTRQGSVGRETNALDESFYACAYACMCMVSE